MPSREKATVTTVEVEHSSMNRVLIALIIAAIISWIVFVAKASNNDLLGDNAVDFTGSTTPYTMDQARGLANKMTATICFQAVIATAAFYFVLNHYMERH